MQKQGLVYQYAAGLIEFIVLALYSHTLWSHLQHAAYTVIPSGFSLSPFVVFGNVGLGNPFDCGIQPGRASCAHQTAHCLVFVFAAICFYRGWQRPGSRSLNRALKKQLPTSPTAVFIYAIPTFLWLSIFP
jgi:hypothetical protein